MSRTAIAVILLLIIPCWIASLWYVGFCLGGVICGITGTILLLAIPGVIARAKGIAYLANKYDDQYGD